LDVTTEISGIKGDFPRQGNERVAERPACSQQLPPELLTRPGHCQSNGRRFKHSVTVMSCQPQTGPAPELQGGRLFEGGASTA